MLRFTLKAIAIPFLDIGHAKTTQIFGECTMRRALFGEGCSERGNRSCGSGSSSIVADVGTGPVSLLRVLGVGARVIGVDSSDRRLAQARKRFDQQQFEARTGDVDSLPLSAAEVDVVFANMVLHNFKPAT